MLLILSAPINTVQPAMAQQFSISQISLHVDPSSGVATAADVAYQGGTAVNGVFTATTDLLTAHVNQSQLATALLANPTLETQLLTLFYGIVQVAQGSAGTIA